MGAYLAEYENDDDAGPHTGRGSRIVIRTGFDGDRLQLRERFRCSIGSESYFFGHTGLAKSMRHIGPS